MIHRVTISSIQPDAIEFTLKGHPITAANHLDPAESKGVVKAGREYPLELTLVAEGEVEYLPGPDGSFTLAKSPNTKLPHANSHPSALSRVRACGRIMDYMAHDLIRLDGDVTVLVRLRLPQQATDYRRGSWLAAVGTLEATMPSPDHDEAGLKGSIVE